MYYTQTPKQRRAIAGLIIVACIMLSYYFQKRGIETVYTHFFYVPIVLAGIWFERRSLVIAAFLAVALIVIHVSINPEASLLNDVLRGMIFIVIALFVSELSRSEAAKTRSLAEEKARADRNLAELGRKNQEIAHSYQELKEKQVELETSREELKKWYELTVGRELKMLELKERLKHEKPSA
jgi:K+-sensing histidine kinase KdpD